ncbi:MAG: GvpL/GvpF family gas vesicle protein [Bacteroidales bacterium]|nr:GvpL/GvpF family gas vesicle protein [Bacteroidales bacterium]
MATKGIYIYGIVPNFYSTDMFRSLENSGVYAITFQNISAIVSDRNSTHLDYLDRESLGYLLVHHQKTIEDLMGKGFAMLIPMRLGTIVSSKEEVFKILANGYDLIIDTLKKIEHLTEIDLAVTWADFPGTLKEIAGHPDIIAIKDDILKKADTLLKIDQVKVGMLVQAKLKEKNTKVELNILDSLSPISLDIKTHEVMNDEMVTNSAFLINRNNKEKFEQVMDQLDEEYKGLLNFKLVGPLPCYSFYTIEVKDLNSEQVEQARKELGLREETSESEIKKAYLEKAKLFHPDAHPDNGDEENFNRINKAYNTLLDYSVSARQSSKDDLISLAKEKVIENLILVKIKE